MAALLNARRPVESHQLTLILPVHALTRSHFANRNDNISPYEIERIII